ncbi:hypothetical protein AX15_004483 [Amanita polypyramis BW_CC]|nr:hypothetical protein AX15_004483 [Amanita polypyramis BW_CC]
MTETNEELLKILEAHGRAFLSSFVQPLSKTGTEEQKVDMDGEEEWSGIQMSSSEENGSEDEGFEHSDDDFTADSFNVVVFSDPAAGQKKFDSLSKAQMKAFMSSKITKITSENVEVAEIETEESDHEKSNAQNDALLHRLVHTQLLSGSLNPDLNLTPAQRRKALAGRVLELTGTAKLGKGEKAVIEVERRRAAKNVREGLTRKRNERERQRLEEAKNLGNYHPAIKKTFESSFKSKAPRRSDRGLRMGVGRFSGGVLRLSKEDINMAENGYSRGSVNHRTRHGRTRQSQPTK